MPSISSPATLESAVSDHLPWLRGLYRHFHRRPELSMAEHATAGRIEHELTALGLEPQRIGGTGVVAVIETAKAPQSWPAPTQTHCPSRRTPAGVRLPGPGGHSRVRP